MNIKLSNLFRFKSPFVDESEGAATEMKPVATAVKSGLPENFQWMTLNAPSQEALLEVRKDCVDHVPQRTDDVNDAFDQVANTYAAVHEQTLNASPLGEVKAKLEGAMKDGTHRVQSQYVAEVSAAEAQFKDECRGHLTQISAAELSSKKRRIELETQRDNLIQEIVGYETRLTGDPDIRVPSLQRFWLFAVAVFQGVSIGIIDVFLAASIFEFVSNRETAMALSAAFAVLYAGVVLLLASSEKIIHAYDTAVVALQQYKDRGDNKKDKSIQAITLIGVSKETRVRSISMKRIFWVLTGVLLVIRFWTSMHNPRGTAMGIVATVVIVLLSLFALEIEKSVAPPYGDHHGILDKMRAMLGKLNAELLKLSHEEKNSNEPTWLAKAKETYLANMEAAWDHALLSINEAYGFVANYRHLLTQARELADGLRSQFVDTCSEVAGKIVDAKATAAGEDIDYEFSRQQVGGLLTLPLLNDPFSATIESGAFRPEDMRPNRTSAEPNKLLAEVVAANQKPEPQQKTGRARIKVI